jgi:hypothetical protein
MAELLRALTEHSPSLRELDISDNTCVCECAFICV